jgi:lon-related putative ATP-dependent protease
MTTGSTELTTIQLRRVCDPATLGFSSTAELAPLDEIIGQARAVHAVSFGIEIQSTGYHIYALGPAGTGKTTIIRKFLEQKSAAQPTPDDWCYVFNFGDPDRPRSLRLPAGKGHAFQKAMDQLVEELKVAMPRAFEGDQYSQEQERLQKEFEKRQQALFQELEEETEAKGLRLIQTPHGILILPVIHGDVVPPDRLDQLDDETRHEIERRQAEIQDRLRETMRRVRQLYQEARERVLSLDREVVGYAVSHLIEDIQQSYAEFAGIVSFLDEIRTHILDNVSAFRQLQEAEQSSGTSLTEGRQSWFDRYRVNLLVDNRETEGAPVVFESHPTYHNLVGRIQYQARLGTLITDFSLIKAGALHRANGGYLIIDALDVLTKPFAWEALKRALKNKEIRIEPMAEEYALIATKTLEPEPIPLDVKVVLLGEPLIYYLLYDVDEDFSELFKVKADFAQEMDWGADTALQYACFIGSLCREAKIKHFDPSGVARVVEEGARLVAHQGKLSTRFGDVVDLIHQASYWAGQNGNGLVTAVDVQRAIDERIYRSNRLEERLRELVEEGTLLIDTEGDVVGQVNGISVLPLGDYSFGSPSRITARTYVGSAGVLNIDRESKLGGRIHNKGAMILSGYLGGTYAQEAPLALSASITFEQVYEEIEGDSASSAELYALLSSLSGLPLKQSLAVTGSVNQRGQIQAIGGVNEKIEGFFEVCKRKGFTGEQGVIIPRSNIKNLMLRQDVVRAVEAGVFHVYAVSNVDEGIALLTGREAGERQPDGTYPEGTVNRAVQDRLMTLAERVKAFAKPEVTPSPNGTGEEVAT